MAITIGLDFGTHQTKICIENSDSPLHKTYEFYEWENGVYAFPSIIQINKDHTVRYGSIDLDSCLVARKKKEVSKPLAVILPQKPKKPDILKPQKPKFAPIPILAYKDDRGEVSIIPYCNLKGIEKQNSGWKRFYQNKNQSPAYREWQSQCSKIRNQYQIYLGKWEELCKSYGYTLPNELVMPVMPPEPVIDSPDLDIDIEANEQQRKIYTLWKKTIYSQCHAYNKSLMRYNALYSKYYEDLKIWQDLCKSLVNAYETSVKEYQNSIAELPLVYRYFKQASFSDYRWDYEIKAQDLTVLYLSYIVFILEKRFGTDYSIQMGVPASQSTFKRLKSLAVGYLIQAIRLVENVFHNDFEKFLSTPYEELISLIPKYEYSEALKMQYGLMILPEAYAALCSLTANSRIPRGMSIMLDMGGGTTDLSFFVIEDNGEPHIYHFESIAKGLNFFLEYEDRHSSKSVDFSKKKELEDIPIDVFNRAFREFKGDIDTIIKRLTDFFHKDTISRGFMKSAFRDAVQNRPAVYTGGGCYDNRMRMPIYDFSDVIYIDKGILGIPNVVDESKVTIPYSLMATAFGLSIQRLDDEIEVSKKEDLFAKYTNVNGQYSRWDTHREHGMYED